MIEKFSSSFFFDVLYQRSSSVEGWTFVPRVEFSSLTLDSYLWVNSWSRSVLRAVLRFTQWTVERSNSSTSASAVDGRRIQRRQFWSSETLERIARSFRTRGLFSTPISNQTMTTPRFLTYWYNESFVNRGLTTVWLQVFFRRIVLCNVFGLIPGFEAITGKAGFTLGLSFAVWAAVTYCGVQISQMKTVLWFLPSGPSWPMAPVFVLLERISYCFRARSLGVRLWANMLAGHQRIHLVSGIARVPALCLGVIGAPVTVLAAARRMARTGLESIVCVLQSGVFCLRASFYLKEARHSHAHLTPKA